ncbi:hypothetical protein EDD90_3246 [Streptomyces sp. Ag109_O5-1]|uniref:hypothetical protein n=1 Tax=Streptomyces sp. Ag109_O5-1 TaxID=1938851 RepID=UPI000F4F63F3|nr:hypothetical protein [Streptomyces sp. Ag109_O5-1]RPE40210.1 hypothetical protein EDD90_3246 [Streptomyces sp. Ag109_O5-1]
MSAAWLELHTVLSLKVDATEAYRLMHNYRDEELHKSRTAEAYPGQLAMLSGLIATLRAVAQHGDLSDVRKLLAEHERDEQDAYAEAEGKSSRRAADATPGLTERQERLLDAIRAHGGEWTTRRVLGFFALTDPDVVQRGTARRDLATLQRAGHLVLVDTPDNRHYVLHTRKDGA